MSSWNNQPIEELLERSTNTWWRSQPQTSGTAAITLQNLQQWYQNVAFTRGVQYVYVGWDEVGPSPCEEYPEELRVTEGL